ncbi:hypothetical protein LU293_00205 [Moraxella nasovis]|uniref:hypothetical protein n=1 Tax=Moraxella nasovis TaxID=2904121 RepID=UPI001F6040CE|nr:hypothetical protein [Moraxella nasovis]UNU73375.1 hypothetical protein LU293_00205 [Moraxella nasovis]
MGKKLFDDIDEWFNGNRKTTSKSAGSGGSVTLPKIRKPTPKPQAIKNIINGAKSAKKGVANKGGKKLPQVVVKISGSSKGAE